MHTRATLLLVFTATALAAAPPSVTNVRVSQRTGQKLVDILYDVSHDGGGPLTVWVDVSADGGRSYIVKAQTFSGHIGSGITPGSNKQIVWDLGADFDGALVERARVRVTAHAGTVPISPVGMVFIPGGHFMMGDSESGTGVRHVYVSPMFMDRYEVSGQLYAEVYAWAVGNGYNLSPGDREGPDHPVNGVTWYDAMKWCNARSERDGLTPAYYMDANHAVVCRTGSTNIPNAMVRWDVDGYRLPTEAEWEKAARGGLTGKRYPWGDNIDGGMANYSNSGDPFSTNGLGTTPIGFYSGGQFPTGPDTANRYGLYDVCGNLNEWCWDTWTSLATGEFDPRGPDVSGSYRSMRGGSYRQSTNSLDVADRFFSDPSAYDTIRYEGGSSGGGRPVGFRCVRGL